MQKLNLKNYKKHKHIERKKRIIKKYIKDGIPKEYDSKDIFNPEMRIEYGDIIPYFNIEHENQLNKGKIHCSCKMCKFKNKKHSDIKKLRSMSKQLVDLNDGDYDLDISMLNKLKNSIKKNEKIFIKGIGIPGSTYSGQNLDYNDYQEQKDMADFRKSVAKGF